MFRLLVIVILNSGKEEVFLLDFSSPSEADKAVSNMDKTSGGTTRYEYVKLY